jgi:hypothetical protein
VNDAFMRDLIAHWQEHGPQVIDRVAKEQPGTLLKCMTMLVPKEMRIETTNPAGKLSDEALATMIAELEERISARLSGENAKVINGEPAKRQPKSSPERLANAREYMRKRRAAEKAAKRVETENGDAAPSSPPVPPLVD